MSHKIVSQIDAAGYLIGFAIAYESPLEEGVFLIPGGAVDVEPPKVPQGQRAKWLDGAWVLEDLPVDPVEPPPPPDLPPTDEQRIAKIVAEIQDRLDTFARTRRYDGILSACTYATSTVPKFHSEGQYCVEARDATWAKTYDMLDEVQAGTRPVPASIADIEAELPVLGWPE